MRITEILEMENTIYHYGNDHGDHGDSKPKEIYGTKTKNDRRSFTKLFFIANYFDMIFLSF